MPGWKALGVPRRRPKHGAEPSSLCVFVDVSKCHQNAMIHDSKGGGDGGKNNHHKLEAVPTCFPSNQMTSAADPVAVAADLAVDSIDADAKDAQEAQDAFMHQMHALVDAKDAGARHELARRELARALTRLFTSAHSSLAASEDVATLDLTVSLHLNAAKVALPDGRVECTITITLKHIVPGKDNAEDGFVSELEEVLVGHLNKLLNGCDGEARPWTRCAEHRIVMQAGERRGLVYVAPVPTTSRRFVWRQTITSADGSA